MFQTEYIGIGTLARNTNFIGGICKWYYTPVENILTWPAIDPLTQYALSKPTLKDSAVWYGPVTATKRQLSFYELQKKTLSGVYFETKIEGQLPGDDRINLQNLPNHKYIVLAVTRLGYQWLLIGTAQSPLEFSSANDSSNDWQKDFKTKIEFTGRSRHKALLIPFTEEEMGGVDLLTILNDPDGESILNESGETIQYD